MVVRIVNTIKYRKAYKKTFIYAFRQLGKALNRLGKEILKVFKVINKM